MDRFYNLKHILNEYKQNLAGSDSSFIGNSVSNQVTQCFVCFDKGWISKDVSPDHPDFGKLVLCQCRNINREESRFSQLKKFSNLGSLSSCTFDTINHMGVIDTFYAKQSYKKAVEIAMSYHKSNKKWLVISGPHGTGKTYLAAAIANSLIECGYPVLFAHVPELLDELRSSFSPNSTQSYSSLFQQVQKAPFLILDELDTGFTTTWASEKLRQIFHRRSTEKLPTIVTTASDVSELDDYIAVRILNPALSTVLNIGNPEHLLQEKNEWEIPSYMSGKMTLKTFNIDGLKTNDEQKNSLFYALQVSKRWASDRSGWLLFRGKTGTGKTHLAVGVANICKEKGVSVSFVFVPDLMDYLRQTFHPNNPIAYGSAFERVKNAQLLILDDFDIANQSVWEQQKLYQIIVYRHNRRLPMIVTTRLDTRRELSNSIVSRIQDPSISTSVYINAPDYRAF